MDDDKALLEGIVARDESALERFYRKHSTTVYRFALRTLRNPVEASELLNEVMLEVWDKAGNYAGRASVRTWLLSITHHKAVDLVRRNARHDHEDEERIDVEAPQFHAGSLLDMEVSRESGGHVRTCVDALPHGHRQVVYLTFFEGCSYPEIAETLGVPQGTVKTRMLHARQKLLDCIQRLTGAREA
jgi:RNA polymerase sigma-70 factor (ECF subfamily)